MSDLFYSVVRNSGYHIVWFSSSPVILHRERVARAGGLILASNHSSHYDVPLLYYASPRSIDFISIVEIMRRPVLGWLFRGMNALPHDRSRTDVTTARAAIERLRRGRVVGIFPEGNVRTGAASLLHGGGFRPGVARLAQASGAPVVPTVILGTTAYSRPLSYLPLRRTRWGAAFGEPIRVRQDLDPAPARAAFLTELRAAFDGLHAELRAAMGEHAPPLPAEVSEPSERLATSGP